MSLNLDKFSKAAFKSTIFERKRLWNYIGLCSNLNHCIVHTNKAKLNEKSEISRDWSNKRRFVVDLSFGCVCRQKFSCFLPYYYKFQIFSKIPMNK